MQRRSENHENEKMKNAKVAFWTANQRKIKTFVIDNKGLDFPDIQEIEDLHVSGLEEGNTKDSSNPKLEDTENSEHYGIITPDEVKIYIAHFNRDTLAGPDNLTLADLKILINSEIAIILTEW